ncbi:MAG: ABC transporter permease [Bacteroidota bacterium]
MSTTAVNTRKDEEPWDTVLSAKRSLFQIDLKELWQYRDLIWMFVRRDIVTVYKQTILGPIWFVIQPILTTLTYVLIFGNIAGISTDGLPKILFYLSGIVIWTYFADTFNATSRTFIDNTSIFGKVYFPRLAMPISKTISGMMKFFIQFGFFLVILFVFWLNGSDVHPNIWVLMTPLLLLLMAGISLGPWYHIHFPHNQVSRSDFSYRIRNSTAYVCYACGVSCIAGSREVPIYHSGKSTHCYC